MALASRVREFAGLLTQRRGKDLNAWITTVRDDNLPALHAFADGLEKDYGADIAGLTVPHSSRPAEGVNTKIKMIKRQMFGRADFPLLHKRVLLPGGYLITQSKTEPLRQSLTLYFLTGLNEIPVVCARTWRRHRLDAECGPTARIRSRVQSR